MNWDGTFVSTWEDLVFQMVFMAAVGLIVWALTKPEKSREVVTVDLLGDERRQRERVKHLTIPIEKLDEREL